MKPTEILALEPQGLDTLLVLLKKEGYQLVGPCLRDGAIAYDRIEGLADLPVGLRDSQKPGVYRLEKGSPGRYFDYTVGPISWRKFLNPPLQKMWKATRGPDGIRFVEESVAAPPLAFIGVRSCELAAIRIQDRVFTEGPYIDPHYRRSRKDNFIVAVNCAHPGGTCFCVSMETGPKAKEGFDIALTEVPRGGGSLFVATAGTPKGTEILSKTSARPAEETEIHEAESVSADAAKRMGRTLDTTGIHELLDTNFEHPRWQATANRCLSCANCTLVCPTCFCTTAEDRTDLEGEHAERWKRWDSCFTADFSYIHGGVVRSSVKSRYRQWLTHKLGTWIDQFGTSGCVGCGRCITWCPVGIDLTEEIAAIRDGGAATSDRKQSD